MPPVKLDGIVELLRQFPNFGDGWLVAGMLLEGRADYRRALSCYRRAERLGSSQRAALRAYIPLVSEYEKQSSSLAGTGTKALMTLGAAAAAFVLYKLAMAVRRGMKPGDPGKPRGGAIR